MGSRRRVHRLALGGNLKLSDGGVVVRSALGPGTSQRGAARPSTLPRQPAGSSADHSAASLRAPPRARPARVPRLRYSATATAAPARTRSTAKRNASSEGAATPNLPAFWRRRRSRSRRRRRADGGVIVVAGPSSSSESSTRRPRRARGSVEGGGGVLHALVRRRDERGAPRPATPHTARRHAAGGHSRCSRRSRARRGAERRRTAAVPLASPPHAPRQRRGASARRMVRDARDVAHRATSCRHLRCAAAAPAAGTRAHRAPRRPCTGVGGRVGELARGLQPRRRRAGARVGSRRLQAERVSSCIHARTPSS